MWFGCGLVRMHSVWLYSGLIRWECVCVGVVSVVWSDLVWFAFLALIDVLWCDYGVIWYGFIQCDFIQVCIGWSWCCLMWFEVIWSGIFWWFYCDLVGFGVAWYGFEWFGVICNFLGDNWFVWMIWTCFGLESFGAILFGSSLVRIGVVLCDLVSFGVV